MSGTSEAGASEGATAGPSPDVINLSEQLELLRGLVLIVQHEKLSEMEVEGDGIRILLKAPVEPAPSTTVISAIPQFATSVAQQLVLQTPDDGTLAATDIQPGVESVADANLVPIVSPMVGVFYRANSPDNPPLVEVGDYVEVGQEVGIIEAMKVFNEITSEVEGTVVEIRAENAQLIETGGILRMIRKA